MAAPTSVRVESNSITTATLRWTYPGASTISVFRSLDGITYAEITIAETRVAVGTTIYEDTGLSPGTKYWYKLSDDVGSTFSSVVTVVVQVCPGPAAQPSDVSLPRATSEVTPQDFNDLATRVETGLVRFSSPDGRTCVACINDGALVIDCVNYDGCDSIEIIADQNVNSISLPNCENTITELRFIIPPNTTVGIGGWPKGSGFTGDEANSSPVSGGSSGRIILETWTKGSNDNMKSGQSKPGTTTKGTPSGGSAKPGGSGCTCVPGTNGELTIVVCNPDGTPNPTNSLNCASATKGARLIACGGRGPYSWTFGGSLGGVGGDNGVATVAPPANSGSATAGTAYHLYAKFAFSDAGSCTQTLINRTYGCDDVLIGCSSDTCTGFAPTCNNTFPAGCQTLPCVTCTRGVSGCTGTGGATPCTPVSPYCLDTTCTGKGEGGNVCDVRTAPMISAGCTPCGLSTGSTMTVTDSIGTVVSVIMRA